MIAGIIIGGIFILIVIILYNSLISKKNQVTNIFASLDALLKKRYDLIPNLIDSVKTYMNYEKSILTEITNLRTKAMSNKISDDEKIELNSKLSRAIGGVFVAVENYPDLKSNQNFLQLQSALNEIEEQISAARRAYNASIMDFNNAVEMFPTNILAKIMNYTAKKSFEIDESERKNINVGDLFKK